MASDLAQQVPGRVRILGINAAGGESDNALMVEGRVLPWLQDRSDVSVWTQWHVTYRDVVILDTQGQEYARFNLTAHDLSKPENAEALRTLFLEAH